MRTLFQQWRGWSAEIDQFFGHGPSTSFCHLITMDQPIKSADGLPKNMWKKPIGMQPTKSPISFNIQSLSMSMRGQLKRLVGLVSSPIYIYIRLSTVHQHLSGNHKPDPVLCGMGPVGVLCNFSLDGSQVFKVHIPTFGGVEPPPAISRW